jgi:hypothetical protein
VNAVYLTIAVDVWMKIGLLDEDERQWLHCDQKLCRQQRII